MLKDNFNVDDTTLNIGYIYWISVSIIIIRTRYSLLGYLAQYRHACCTTIRHFYVCNNDSNILTQKCMKAGLKVKEFQLPSRMVEKAQKGKIDP